MLCILMILHKITRTRDCLLHKRPCLYPIPTGPQKYIGCTHVKVVAPGLLVCIIVCGSKQFGAVISPIFHFFSVLILRISIQNSLYNCYPDPEIYILRLLIYRIAVK